MANIYFGPNANQLLQRLIWTSGFGVNNWCNGNDCGANTAHLYLAADLSEAVRRWGTFLTSNTDLLNEEICATLKHNPTGFRCFNQPKPPTTKEQAIERYASKYPAENICEPLKHNSPFQCTRTVEAPMVTRLSLSLASAQAVFAIVGIIFVTILRKMKVEASSSTPKAEVSE